MTFTESGLRFDFESSWAIKKYDSHTYYQGLSGAGMSAMDFVGFRVGEPGIYLFEIKNYGERINPYNGFPIYANVKSPAELARVIGRKVNDTLLAIDAIRQYYQRNWWYRRFLPLIRKWPNLSNDRVFWTRVYETIQQKGPIHIVLWLELPLTDPLYRQNLQQLIEKKLSQSNFQFYFASLQDNPFADNLMVAPAP